MLNSYGFDCSTIGREIQPAVPKGKAFVDFEKDWASGGDCFISILTPRNKTADELEAEYPGQKKKIHIKQI